ncbi:(2Fe-2S)-binding protein [Rhodococcus triatomae]|uniref:Carbon-monoxide dehydrogenase small subunit n=1 Tax=Rhodococcus triatomae TaxID=300028 RepID=A0A1G8BAF2_9NOCA|nr:(2Fe-2S)-binding protein [Rhodococcus triatomae]QNG17490.1 (2Fe-2S)-binding protein [Rhodococcus triatomae]QNG22842.1 (2Fe-2S)-binding protein [Rhodococcus triatomae]SDH30242.1 carbon-monoxide dehydrogenase small subunit [Rhodococcus triatomae]
MTQGTEGVFGIDVGFTLNGDEQIRHIATNTVLLDLLRDDLGCRGVRRSCERGVCGACTVLVDDVPVASCSTFAFAVDGANVDTVEGLAGPDGSLSAPQQAFSECGGYQCGFCTSGMLMLATGLLRQDPDPERAKIREWISSNTCRCTGYEMILESVERAARLSCGACAEEGDRP